MKRLGWTIVALACAGCTPPAANDQTNVTVVTGNAVEAVVENKAETPSPAVNAMLNDAPTEAAAAGANGIPAEVQKFIERREGCEHWASEPDWDNAERKKQIEEAVKDLCPGIDTQLAALRKRHAGDPEVIAALKDFEPLGMEP